MRPRGHSERDKDRKAAMSLRKLFWNFGGKLPVWLVHPGQIILLIERKLGATLFKGVTLPEWWTPRTVPALIFAVGFIMAFVFGIGGAIYTIQKFGDDFSVELLLTICAVGCCAGFALVGSAALSTLWPWRHLRVAVCTVEEGRAACKIARSPCVFAHADGTSAQARFVHWFWGPTLGSRDWKFHFRTPSNVGNETNHSFMIVSDRTGESMSFNIGGMVDVDNIYPWRGWCLYGVHRIAPESWVELLHGLLMRSSRKHKDAEESVARLSSEAGLQRMELGAWSDVVGRQLAYYFESGRSTRPDKEIGKRLRDVSFNVIKAYMKHVRDHGLPGHDMNKLEKLFEAMDWPPLVSARKRRAG